MDSFRKSMLCQIRQFETGRIFTFRDLSYEPKRAANVAVLLSEQCRRGELARLRKGAYYRPAKSILGFGQLPVYQDEQLRYLTEKLGGYISGPYIYNKMGLTEQTTSTITIATPRPTRQFRFDKLNVTCRKAYFTSHTDKKTVEVLRLLDAICDLKHIPGTSEQDVYDRVKNLFFSKYSEQELERTVSLAQSYPPRVRKTVADLLGDLGHAELQSELEATLLPTTRFNTNYKTSSI